MVITRRGHSRVERCEGVKGMGESDQGDGKLGGGGIFRKYHPSSVEVVRALVK
jgi:hypothetical protein